MSWQIDLFYVAPGQDPCKVRDVQYDWEQHSGYEDAGQSDDSDRWIAHVLALIDGLGLGIAEFERTDEGGHVMHVGLIQPDGPQIRVSVYPWTVDVRAASLGQERYDGEGFAALWQVCKVLAEQAGCAVFPEYDDDPTDMTMDAETARELDPWA